MKNKQKTGLIINKLRALGSTADEIASNCQKLGVAGCASKDGSLIIDPLQSLVERLSGVECFTAWYDTEDSINFGTFSAGTITRIKLSQALLNFRDSFREGKYPTLIATMENWLKLQGYC